MTTKDKKQTIVQQSQTVYNKYSNKTSTRWQQNMWIGNLILNEKFFN